MTIPRRPPATKTKRNFAMLGSVALLLAACGSGQGDDDSGAAETSPPTVIAPPEPEPTTTEPSNDERARPDISDLYESRGNPDANDVIISAQGGPTPQNLIDEVIGIAEGVDLEQTLFVNVHQAQTINPERFTEADIDFEQAKAADRETVDMLASVIEHFKADGRAVHVLGISFGAFVVQDLIANHGTEADNYVIAVGRLDMPADVWAEFAEGRTVGFIDGVDVVAVPIEEAGMGAGSPAGDRNMARLAAGLGHNRYTELLADADLGKVVYLYGETDEQVGRLTDAEIAFLNARGATVASDPGGHDGPIENLLFGRLGELFLD